MITEDNEMRRSATVLFACALAFCGLAGCQSKSSISTAKVTMQDSASYEDALKECFDAMHTSGGGGIFYAYMFPDEAVKAIKDSGKYDDLVKTFNESQEKSFALEESVYTFGSVTSSQELTDEQRSGIKRYFVNLCDPYIKMTEKEFDIKEGYELTFDYLRNGEKGGEESVIVLRLNDEGWKIITQ